MPSSDSYHNNTTPWSTTLSPQLLEPGTARAPSPPELVIGVYPDKGIWSGCRRRNRFLPRALLGLSCSWLPGAGICALGRLTCRWCQCFNSCKEALIGSSFSPQLAQKPVRVWLVSQIIPKYTEDFIARQINYSLYQTLMYCSITLTKHSKYCKNVIPFSSEITSV